MLKMYKLKPDRPITPKKFRKIFNYYKKKYKLNTKLIFNENYLCSFNFKVSIISYDIEYAKKGNPIFVLLHEIGHAIDWKNNEKRFKRELENIPSLYYVSHNQWKKVPLEIRANKFAKKELKKWIT